MGVFETIFKRPKADLKAEGYFKMLNGYTPVFTNAPESLYEMELTRAAIHSFASFASKLKPEISGAAKKHLERTLQFKPNPFIRKVRRRSKNNMKRKLKKFAGLKAAGKIDQKTIEQSYQSWRGHASKGNCYHLIRRTDQYYKSLFGIEEKENDAPPILPCGEIPCRECNNPFDASPVWEDCTNAVIQGVAHVFTNKTNTSAQWQK